MLQKTYDKVNALFEKAHGYLSTRELLENRITTIQIRSMLEDGKIEKISHGHYMHDKPKSGYLLAQRLLLSRADKTGAGKVICCHGPYGQGRDEAVFSGFPALFFIAFL